MINAPENWKYICKCGDGTAFFKHKKTGEIMNWHIKGELLSASAQKHFGCEVSVWRNMPAFRLMRPSI